MRHLRHRTAIADVGAAISQGKPLGPAGGIALILAFTGLAIALTHIISAALTQAQLEQARQALAAANDRAAAANIAADQAKAALASKQSQIEAFCRVAKDGKP